MNLCRIWGQLFLPLIITFEVCVGFNFNPLSDERASKPVRKDSKQRSHKHNLLSNYKLPKRKALRREKRIKLQAGFFESHPSKLCALSGLTMGNPEVPASDWGSLRGALEGTKSAAIIIKATVQIVLSAYVLHSVLNVLTFAVAYKVWILSLALVSFLIHHFLKLTNPFYALASSLVNLWRADGIGGVLQTLRLVVSLGVVITGNIIPFLGLIFWNQLGLGINALRPILNFDLKSIPSVIKTILQFTKRQWDRLRKRMFYGQSEILPTLKPSERGNYLSFIGAVGDTISTKEFELIRNKNYLELKQLFRRNKPSANRVIEHLKYNMILHDNISLSIITRSIIHQERVKFTPDSAAEILDHYFNPLISSDYLVTVLQHPAFSGQTDRVIGSALFSPELNTFSEYFFGLARVLPNETLTKIKEMSSLGEVAKFWTEERALLSCIFFSLILKGAGVAEKLECKLGLLEKFLDVKSFRLSLDIMIKKSGIVGRMHKFKEKGKNDSYTLERGAQKKSASKVVASLLSKLSPSWTEENLANLIGLILINNSLEKKSDPFLKGVPLETHLSKSLNPKMYTLYLVYYQPRTVRVTSAQQDILPLKAVYGSLRKRRNKKNFKVSPCKAFKTNDFDAKKWIYRSEESLEWKFISPDSKASIVDLAIYFNMGKSPTHLPEPRPVSMLGFSAQLRKRLKGFCETKEAKKIAKRRKAKPKRPSK